MESEIRTRKAYLERLDDLVKVSSRVLSETTIEGLLQTVIDVARELTGARLAAAGHGFREDSFRVEAISKSPDGPSCPSGDIFTVEKGGVHLEILEKQSSIRLNEAELCNHPAWWGLPQGHAPLRGLVGAPLIGRGGKIRGLIMVSDKEQGEFTDEDETLINHLASLASLGLRHIEDRADAERRVDEVEATLMALMHPMVVYDEEGFSVTANAAAIAAYGLDPVGLTNHELMEKLSFKVPEVTDSIPVEKLPSSRALRGETTIGERFTVRNARGRESTVLVSASPVLKKGRPRGAVVIWNDITRIEKLHSELRKAHDELEMRVRERTEELAKANEALQAEIGVRRKTEEALRKANKALLILSSCNEALVRATEEQELLDRICQIIADTDGYRMAWVGYTDENKTMRPVAKAGHEAGFLESPNVARANKESCGVGDGKTILTGNPCIIANIAENLEAAPWRSEALDRGYRSVISLPLTARKETFGVLSIYANNPDAFNEEDVRLLMQLAEDLSYGITSIRTRMERERAQKELEAYTGKLERSNKELWEFAYVASHDLQEPLRKIQVFCDRIRGKYAQALDLEGIDYLRRVQGCADRMRSLVSSLLDYSMVAVRSKPFTRIDLGKIAMEAVEDLSLLIEESNGMVELGDLPEIEAEGDLMSRLFQNLISNGLKFRGEERAVVKIHGEVRGENCIIYVEDNGIGFEEKYLDRIFRPFQHLGDRVGPYVGPGMGLAICRKIAEHHNGSITARSKPREGTTFIITLPLRQPR
jgi:PAS domain S-box-containing protein